MERYPTKRVPEETFDGPGKYLLHCPSVATIFIHLSCAIKVRDHIFEFHFTVIIYCKMLMERSLLQELKSTECLVFYFSGPGKPPLSQNNLPPDELPTFGLNTKEMLHAQNEEEDEEETQRLHLSDILTFLRKPMVLILDTPASHSFRVHHKLKLVSIAFIL
jgi:hypothetical protein